MNFIGIALIILVVVGSVHFVHRVAFKQGKKAGIELGRMQVLEEDIKRASIQVREHDDVMESLVDNMG